MEITVKDQAFIVSIARMCHEANRAYCRTLGDSTQKPWDQAEQWQRDSAIEGVKFKLEHPEATPEAQHEAWAETKVRDGWTYGPKKDAFLKTHPCLVPYSDLPESQRVKDKLFAGIVSAFTG